MISFTLGSWSISCTLRVIVSCSTTTINSRSSTVTNSAVSLQDSIERVSNYLLLRGLTVEPSKPLLVNFTRKHYTPVLPLSIGTSLVYPVSEAKFLRLTLDKHLTWEPHTKNLISKCKKLINIIKCLHSTWWGAEPSSLITIFRATIRSSIDYGAMVIPIKQNSLFKKVEIIQRRALRLALGFRNSSPNNLVLAEAKEPAPRFRLQFLSDKFLLKVFSTTWHPLLTSIPCLIRSVSKHKNYRNLLDLLLVRAHLT